MEVAFDFRKERSGIFGVILRPVARVFLKSKNRVIQEVFYVDSGADITLIPRSVGEALDLSNPTPREIFDIKGIGEKGVPIVIRRVELEIGFAHFSARIGWALIEDVPSLLGREDVFKYGEITFIKNQRTVFSFLLP